MAERSRSDLLQEALDQLIRTNLADITGAAVMTTDGMLLASRIGADVALGNPDRTAAIAATVMGVTSRVVGELKMGRTEETIVRAEGGYLLIMPVNAQIILTLMLRTGANLGLARIDARDTCKSITLVMNSSAARAVGGTTLS